MIRYKLPTDDLLLAFLAENELYEQFHTSTERFADSREVLLHILNLIIGQESLELLKEFIEKYQITVDELRENDLESLFYAVETGSINIVSTIMGIGINKEDLLKYSNQLLITSIPYQDISEMFLYRSGLDSPDFEHEDLIEIMYGMVNSGQYSQVIIKFLESKLNRKDFLAILKDCPKFKNLKLFAYLVNTLDLKLNLNEIKLLLKKSLKYNHLKIAQCIVFDLGLISSDIDDDYLSLVLISLNKVETAIWFIETFEVENLGEKLIPCFKQACRNKNREMILWILPVLKFEVLDEQFPDYLIHICEIDPEIVREAYLAKSIPINREDIFQNFGNRTVLQLLSQYGNIELLNWFLKTFKIQTKDFNPLDCLVAAIFGEKLNVCRYLSKKYNLTGLNIWKELIISHPEINHYIWKSGILMFNWVESNFELTSDYLKEFILSCKENLPNYKDYPINKYLIHYNL